MVTSAEVEKLLIGSLGLSGASNVELIGADCYAAPHVSMRL